MKRLVLSLSSLALILNFTACEQHTAAALPPHYQHKMGGHTETAHAGEAHAKPETHAKPEAAHPAPGDSGKKEH